MEALTWTSKTVPIEKLIPADYNPRKLSQDSETQLDRSIKKFSLADPIVINFDNKVIGGHQRLKILKKSGVKTVDVRVPSRLLSETEEKELNLRLNKNLGEWDFDALAKFDEDMLKEVGFNPDELDHIFKVETLPEADDVPDARPTTDIKPGDLFQLGEHRLLCGDSTKAEDVARLMGGEKADFLFTSPPYNLGISAQLRGNTVVGKRGNVYENYDDNKTQIEWLSLMSSFTAIWLEYSEYVCVNVQSLAGNSKALWEYIYAFRDNYCDLAIWDKGTAAPAVARCVMNSVFEMMFMFAKDNPNRSIRTADFRGNVSNVFDVPPQRKNENSKTHGATFPIELPIKIIETFTQREMVVADCFGGSGSTLIACEQTSRKCRMIEIDPIYCQVIIDRWEGISGKTAKRI